WDPQGNYLYFLSDREFAPQLSNIEFNYATNRPTYIYALALRKDVKHPFPPESDEVTISKSDEAAAKPTASPAAEKPAEAAPTPDAATAAKPEAAPKPPATMTIDFDNLVHRVARVPVNADNY